MFNSDLMCESLLRTLSGEQGFAARKPTMLALVGCQAGQKNLK